MKSSKYAVLATSVVAGLALAVSGCGSSGTPPPAAAPTPGCRRGRPAGGGSADRGGGPEQGRRPGGAGGSGKVAAVSGRTAQVQNQSGQVAVTWTAKTTFTQQVATKASALKVGDCVVAMPARAAGSGSSKTDADAPVAATTVRITAPVNGLVHRRPAARAGGGTPPSGAPSGAPPVHRRRRAERSATAAPAGFGFGAFGEVTAVSGSGFTVESARPGPTSTSTKVTTTAETTWTTTSKATAAAVKVGRCVSSMGRADSTGAITAVSMTVSSPVGGECTPASCAVGSGARGQAGRGPTETQNS